MSEPEYTLPRLLYCLRQIHALASKQDDPDMDVVRWAEAALNESKGPEERFPEVLALRDASVPPLSLESVRAKREQTITRRFAELGYKIDHGGTRYWQSLSGSYVLSEPEDQPTGCEWKPTDAYGQIVG